MRRPATLPVFSAEERDKAHTLLGSLVVSMMGRKLEEGDWTEVYCNAKGIPARNWSNLDIDVMHGNLGVEQKMLKQKSNLDLADTCGKTLMHPSATRSIRVPPKDTDANEAMWDVLTQYTELIQARTQKVSERYIGDAEPDMRTGWLLWQESLRQFLYFEEEMLLPNPDDYTAEWHSSGGKGARKPSTNLWIYERETGRKRYSITTEAGAKIQPYFDVPPPSDPNLYLFTVIGEAVEVGFVRVWLSEPTARELIRLLGSLDTGTLSQAATEAAGAISELEDQSSFLKAELAQSVVITEDAYKALTEVIPGVSDEHTFQLVAKYLRSLR